MAEDGLPKPAFNAFALLHWLGEQRLALKADDVLVTRRKDGSLALAVWNLTGPGAAGSAKDVELHFDHARIRRVQITRVDADHGDVHGAYQAMGAPRYPTSAQIEKLRAAARLSHSETLDVKNGSVEFKIPTEGLVLVETVP